MCVCVCVCVCMHVCVCVCVCVLCVNHVLVICGLCLRRRGVARVCVADGLEEPLCGAVRSGSVCTVFSMLYMYDV